MEFPPFYGRDDPKAYLEWEKRIELVFDSKNYSELKKVRKATFEFYGYANTWWDQLETCRRRNGKNPVKTWAEMKAVMRKRFVPCGYHQEQHYEDSFRKLEDLMLKYLQDEQQPLKKRNTKPKVEAKPSTLTKAIRYDEELAAKGELPLVNVQEKVQPEISIPTRYQQHGFIYSMLIKESPPDSRQHFQAHDCTVSRTKLFEEGEYDMIMGSSEKSHVPCSAQMKSKSGLGGSATNWTTFSPHLEHSSKWNQSIPSSGQKAIQLSNQMIPDLRELDLCVFKRGLRPNQEELTYEPNYFGNVTHHRIRENWNQSNRSPDVNDLNFTSQRICFRPYSATEPKIVSSSPTQELSRHETTWEMLMDLLASQQAQDRNESPLDHKDTAHLPKRVCLFLYLKNSKPSPIKSFQTYVWHPGGISSKPNKPISWELKRRSSRIISRCMHKEFKG